MNKRVCIMCGRERNGLDVKDDNVIRAMRWVKRNITKNARNYHMVVCKEDFLDYRKKRERYERKQIAYVVIGVLFLALLLAFSSGRIIGAVLYGGIVVVFMYVLSLLSYIPAVDMPLARQKRGILQKSS